MDSPTPTITLPSGRELTITPLQNKDLPLLMRSLPALAEFGKWAKANEEKASGIEQSLPVLNESVWAVLFELEAAMTGLSLEEIYKLELGDGIDLLLKVSAFLPKAASPKMC
jgi:hypothetical protein